jgi:hypothetical protein
MGKDMDLNFEIFMIVLLVLSIVVVGNFLRDGESNYLEGALLVVSQVKVKVGVVVFADVRADCVPYHRCCGVVLPQPGCCYVERHRECGSPGVEDALRWRQNPGKMTHDDTEHGAMHQFSDGQMLLSLNILVK